MTARTGLTLRLLGPLIQAASLIVLLRVRDQGRQVFGMPVEYPIYASLAFGLALVVIGLAFVRPDPRLKGPRDR
jgi:hypothetical protein